MKLLPDENPTQFDYLHAIRALVARSGNKQIFDLADAGMQLGDPGAQLARLEIKCASLQEQLARSADRYFDMQIAIDAVWAMWTEGAPLNLAVELVRPLVTKTPKSDPLMDKVKQLVSSHHPKTEEVES